MTSGYCCKEIFLRRWDSKRRMVTIFIIPLVIYSAYSFVSDYVAHSWQGHLSSALLYCDSTTSHGLINQEYDSNNLLHTSSI